MSRVIKDYNCVFKFYFRLTLLPDTIHLVLFHNLWLQELLIHSMGLDLKAIISVPKFY